MSLRLSKTYPVLAVMVATAKEIDLNGFVSKSHAYKSGAHSTFKNVLIVLKSDFDYELSVKTPAMGNALDVIKWARDQWTPKPGNDFAQKCKKYITQSDVTEKQIPFIITLFNTKKSCEAGVKMQTAATKQSKNSKFIGIEKKRDDFFVKLTEAKYIDRLGSYLNKVQDRDGNIGIVFSSQRLDFKGINLTIGDCFLMRATPKRHQVSDYHGGNETVFNRINILENVGTK